VAEEGQYAFTGNPILIIGPAVLSSPGSGNPNLSWMVPLNLGANVIVATSGRQTQIRAVALGASTLTFNAGGDVLPRHGQQQQLVKNNVSASPSTARTPTRGRRPATTARSTWATPPRSAPRQQDDHQNGFLGFTRSSTCTLDDRSCSTAAASWPTARRRWQGR
jgi:hypothetical protein